MSAELERYAAIGDMRTLGLVDDTGSLDWWCWPRFDSPSVFGRLLDADGGHWQIGPTEPVVARRQVYLSATNVLVTRMHSESGVLEVDDLMAVGDAQLIVRRARCVRGTIGLHSTMVVRPDYGRAVGHFDEHGDDGIEIHVGDAPPLLATSSIALDVDAGVVRAATELREGDAEWFTLGDVDTASVDIDTIIDRTVDYWQTWTAQSTYRGRWRESVERSALVLKLLTSVDTGGLIAAGTTSLPTIIGGERNWDYRYVWIRDAAFTLYAFLELGYASEAAAFTDWLAARLETCAERIEQSDRPPLSPLYDLDGNDDLPETEVEHWSGYADSRPVRIGNAASEQTQLDIYGELIDSMYIADKQSDGVSLATWRHVCALVDWVIDHWDEADGGMWEGARTDPRRYTSSLLMCWVAVDRAMRMARRRGRPADLVAWHRTHDEMHSTLVEQGFSDELQAFTQTLDGDTLDASILLMPLVKFIAPTDPMWISTLAAIGEGLAHGPLVDRYDPEVSDDGLPGDEGSFTICSFWYVEAMSRSGRVEEARRHFDRLLTYATPTGLFSEEIDPTGRLLGNFPQAFTHLALISAAVSLDERLAPTISP